MRKDNPFLSAAVVMISSSQFFVGVDMINLPKCASKAVASSNLGTSFSGQYLVNLFRLSWNFSVWWWSKLQIPQLGLDVDVAWVFSRSQLL